MAKTKKLTEREDAILDMTQAMVDRLISTFRRADTKRPYDDSRIEWAHVARIALDKARSGAAYPNTSAIVPSEVLNKK